MSKNTIEIENAKIIFRNLSGSPTKFNAKGGERSFCALINHEDVQPLLQEGWNVKYLKPLDESDEPQPYLKVKVNFGTNKPNVFMIDGKHKTRLDEETIGMIDYADIENVDLVITPYHWSVSGKEGTAAYVKTMYVTIVEDPFTEKYSFDGV